jgi:hypothetical protein
MTVRLLLLVNVLLLAIAFAMFTLISPGHLKAYQLYLSESRPALQLDYTALSQDWDEAALKAAFSPHQVVCGDSTPSPEMADRSCYIDIDGPNGHPAMLAAFHFKGGLLDSASVNIPWWSHQPALAQLRGRFGLPDAAQAEFMADVRLLRWQLPNGSAVFYNRDRPFDFTQFNGIYWASPRRCEAQQCIRPRARPPAPV